MRDRPVAETSSFTTHVIHMRQTSMPRRGFEPIIPANELLHIDALDRAVTGIGICYIFVLALITYCQLDCCQQVNKNN